MKLLYFTKEKREKRREEKKGSLESPPTCAPPSKRHKLLPLTRHPCFPLK